MSGMVDFSKTETNQIPLICVLGPTASGKTSLAVDLAIALDGEVISADALAVYKGMDIGTAKPAQQERRGVPHHCLDVLDPKDGCDAQRWLHMAEDAVVDIDSRGKVPIVAGGTPMYFKLLVEGISAGPPKDTRIRAELERRYREEGKESLYAELQRVDPAYAEDRHPNDAKRIVRALEVYQISGRPYSSFHRTDGIRRTCWRTLLLGLDWDKEQLHQRINARAKAMFTGSLIDEVKALDGRMSKQAKDGVGYKEVLGYLHGAHDRDHALYLVQRNSRLLAKHQITWYRRFRDIIWLPGGAPGLSQRAVSIAKSFLEGDDMPDLPPPPGM